MRLPCKDTKCFRMNHRFFNTLEPKFFDEFTAPTWLTGENTVKGSTMDCRWFWEKYILTLEIGESRDTTFQRITRVDCNETPKT